MGRSVPQETRKRGDLDERRRQPSAEQSERALNPFPWYRQMRATNPVCYDPTKDIWSLFRYDDVQLVLSDPATYSSRFTEAELSRRLGESAREIERSFEPSLITTDPPRHRELRGLVSQAFTPRAVADMAPRIAGIARRLLDEVVPTGRMDVIRDLSYPLPVQVIARMLGIPSKDRERFKRWTDELVGLGDLTADATAPAETTGGREMSS